MGVSPIRILILDDHPIIREGLSLLFRGYADLAVAGVARDGIEGINQIRALTPDCLILGLDLPSLSGIEAIRLFLQEQPDLGIVVYTGHKEENVIYQALQAGARAYVLKGAPVSALVSAIREVHHGGYWLSTEVSPSIVKRYLANNSASDQTLADYQALSSREKQVFVLLAKGLPVQEIGASLFISIKTVYKHQSAIKKKLKVRNAAEMAIYAIHFGLVVG